jgi:hypothetical protein
VTDDLVAMQAELKRLTGKGARRKLAAGQSPDTSLKRVKRRRARQNSHTKGNRYELKIAKKLQRWTGERFYRTPLSGGWAKAKTATGDVNCDNEAWLYHTEIKKRERWCLEDLLTGSRRNDEIRGLLRWWLHNVETCPRDDNGMLARRPLLIFARNNQPDLMMLYDVDFYSAIRRSPSAEWLPRFTFTIDTKDRTVRHGNGTVFILTLDDFLAACRPPKGTKNSRKWKHDPGRLVVAATINDNEEKSA